MFRANIVLTFLAGISLFLPAVLVEGQRCLGAFDMYFVLDKSASVKSHFKNETVQFVEQMAASFISPELGMSFITFSKTAEVVLPLTVDRQKIDEGIKALRSVTTKGNTYLNLGFIEANRQIKQIGGDKASVILALTDGELNDKILSQKEADKSRELGASVFTVGVAGYNLTELQSIADKPSEDHVFFAGSYDNLDSIIDKIVDKACIEIREAAPTQVCTQEPYDVVLSGRGFTRTNNISNVICNFRLNGTNQVTTPKTVEARRIECPGPVLLEDGSSVILQVSVNGKTFVSSNITITASPCIAVHTNHTALALGLFFFFLILLLLLLWWFWPLLCCAKRKDEVPPASPTSPEKGKWPKVDSSYYGRGGGGGIAPMTVRWGDRGSTEAGSKLTKAKGAKDFPEENDNPDDNKPSCLDLIKSKLSAFKSWALVGYNKAAQYRPRPGGNSKLYTDNPNTYAKPSSTSSV